MLRSAWRNNTIIEDSDDMMENFELDYIQREFIRHSEYKEYIQQNIGREKLYDSVKMLISLNF